MAATNRDRLILILHATPQMSVAGTVDRSRPAPAHGQRADRHRLGLGLQTTDLQGRRGTDRQARRRRPFTALTRHAGPGDVGVPIQARAIGCTKSQRSGDGNSSARPGFPASPRTANLRHR